MSESRRRCTAVNAVGIPCGAAPLVDEPQCFWHSPKHREEAAEARRQGGMHRKTEVAVAHIFDFQGLTSQDDVIRLLAIAISESLLLPNSVQRNKALIQAASVARQVREVIDLERRLLAIEAMLEIGNGGAGNAA